MKTVERNAEVMAHLIDDLLDVSRIISGKMRVEVERVDLALVVERAIESVSLGAEAKHIQIHTKLDKAGAHVVGDAGRLQQVVWNLLTNAVKFTPRNGDITVLLRRTGASVEFVVADTGRGIAPDQVQNVFQPFWQENRRGAGAPGLGLGLAICRKLVELHGGAIEARSEGEGRGATFVLTLPLATEPATRTSTTTGSDEHEPSIKRPQLEGLRVLAVEDDEDALALVRTVLEDCGCVVTTATNVGEAIAAIDREPPDVLVSDIGLPDANGHDLIRHIRALPPERGGLIPAAAITAYAHGHDRLKALAAGYIVHVPKPVDPDELAMVVAALASHRHRPLH